jgi:hypothetical protein
MSAVTVMIGCSSERTKRLGSHYRTGNYFDEFAPVHCPPEA